MDATGLTVCVIFRIPTEGLAAFHAYEDAVLPVLGDHDGKPRQRLRTANGFAEIHVIWFPSATSFDAYRAGPRRVPHAPWLVASGASVALLNVSEIA